MTSLPIHRSLRQDQKHVAALPVIATQTVTFAKEALLRHPGDFLLPAYLAESLLEFAPKKAFEFTNFSLKRNHNFSRTHILAATLLHNSKNYRQACMEYKYSMLLSEKYVEMLASMVDLFSYSLLSDCLPTRYDMIVPITDRLRTTAPKLAATYASRSATANPGHAGIWSRVGHFAIKSSPHQSLTAFLTAYNLAPTVTHAIPLSRAYRQQGAHSHAQILLTNALNQSLDRSDRAKVFIEMGELFTENTDFNQARSYFEKALLSAAGYDLLLRKTYNKLSVLEEKAGNHNRAKWAKEQSRRN